MESAEAHPMLDRLAQLYGIQPDYVDIWGNTHPIPPETTDALLRAMGVPTGDPAAMERALQEREERPFARLLPPVIVARSDDESAPTLPLTLPRGRPVEGLFWALAEEGGAQHGGPLRPDALSEGVPRTVGERSVTCYEFSLPLRPPEGYHTLSVWSGGQDGERLGQCTVIITPPACFTPAALQDGGRIWGLAAQLYGVRSARNWGIGDFSDLATLVQTCARWGGEVVGLNPLHALFPHNPRHESPYCPSSRLWLNIMYIDPEAVPEFSRCAEARQMAQTLRAEGALEAVRDTELVDYLGVARAKRPLLEALYRFFRAEELGPEPGERGLAFRAFQREGGRALRLQCLHETLQQHFFGQDEGVWGWPLWPEPYREPDSAEVRAFAEAHAEEVELFEYLQWLADEQLARVAALGEEAGMTLGLYRDLSVSVDRAGAEVWANPGAFALDASVGAPPDALGPQGQNWGLPPLIPDVLREEAYAPFIAVVRQNMRHAGAVRIDHVMGLMRLFWIPPDKTPADGAYVSYPLDDLLGIVALESQRNRCLVIGEDLGTVPDEVRDKLQPRGVLSYRLMIFEKEHEHAFRAPADYPAQALVAATTHDLPTVRGYWEGRDMALRDELDLFPSAEVRQQMYSDRARDRALLLQALVQSGALPEGASTDPADYPQLTPELALAMQSHLAGTPSQLMVVQLEDLLGQLDQANLPGTTFEHPNWKRKLRCNLEQLDEQEQVKAIVESLAEERPGPRR